MEVLRIAGCDGLIRVKPVRLERTVPIPANGDHLPDEITVPALSKITLSCGPCDLISGKQYEGFSGDDKEAETAKVRKNTRVGQFVGFTCPRMLYSTSS